MKSGTEVTAANFAASLLPFSLANTGIRPR
jgi:hypothetical protein